KSIPNQEEAEKIVEDLKKADYKVSKVTQKQTKRKPTAPFITSTLQRAASSKLGYGVSKTMQIAQKLYEGIELDSGSVGLITYMRTDSTRISDDARDMAKDFITQTYGENYYPETPNNYVKGKQNVQDAHEEIRPSYPDKTPESIKQYLTPEKYKLYKLIWEKFMSSQMANSVIANKTVEITADKDYTLRVGTSSIVFEGFLKLYDDADEEEKKKTQMPDLKKDDILKCKKVNPKQHFTQPPPRFTEASLVKALEEYGIGRPSTYASIITKIQTRNYVEKLDKALAPTLLGKTVSKQLVTQFKEIMDYKFTAGMETKLDDIADEKLVWNKVLRDFYDGFIPTVDEAMHDESRVTIDTKVTCPNCGKPMVLRSSRFGNQFLGCSGYPECKTAMSMNALEEGYRESSEPEKSEEKCEKCNGEMLIKTGPYGKYLECTSCKNRKRIVKTTGVACPKCGKELLERKSRYGKLFYGCAGYPDCNFALWNEPTGNICPECKSLLVKKVLKKGTFEACSNKECKYAVKIAEPENEV
ncbi:type I DNA topoisomerase, partial [bacterium]|nr:type I DNA topoisomerase [bacterium]